MGADTFTWLTAQMQYDGGNDSAARFAADMLLSRLAEDTDQATWDAAVDDVMRLLGRLDDLPRGGGGTYTVDDAAAIAARLVPEQSSGSLFGPVRKWGPRS